MKNNIQLFILYLFSCIMTIKIYDLFELFVCFFKNMHMQIQVLVSTNIFYHVFTNQYSEIGEHWWSVLVQRRSLEILWRFLSFEKYAMQSLSGMPKFIA